MIHSKTITTFLFTCLTLLSLSTLNIVSATQHNTSQNMSGKVISIITAASFTYAEVDTGKEKLWTAGSGITPLKKGDSVIFTTSMPMIDFHSKTLNRDFPIIYFVDQYITSKKISTASTLHSQSKNKSMIKPFVAKYAAKLGEVKTGGFLREITMNGLNSSNKTLSDFKGNPLIINVWASWCGPCRAEMDSLERLAKRYNGKQFNIIGISTDDYRDRAETLIRQTGITFDNFLDSKLQLEKMLGANTIPLTILVDKHGRILEKVSGARTWDSPKIIKSIGQAFNIELI